MNKVDYNKKMKAQIVAFDHRPQLLLHCCCAPCSTACIERLKDYFDLTLLFYNPNIEEPEYSVRKQELIKLMESTHWAKILDCDHEEQRFISAVQGLEQEPEGGARCKVCFSLRLAKTKQLAKANGFEYFTTTLTISPLKDAQLLNQLGEQLSEDGCRWLYSDFKKEGGYLKSCQLSQAYGLYRQNYCGCKYSKRG